MVNIIFCDDNSQYLDSLKKVVHRECSKIFTEDEDVTIGPAFGSGEETIKYIRQNYANVLFLDIDMPNLNGFEVARILCREYKHIKIIFMSAYDNFVYSSFEYYPFAYIRKEHISKELPRVLARVKEKICTPERRLIISTTEGLKNIDINCITYIESNRNYCIVHLSNGKNFTSRGTLTSLETEISGKDFFRIHSAFLINLSYVEKTLDNGLLLVHNSALPIAQKRMQEFKKTYMQYIRGNLGT